MLNLYLTLVIGCDCQLFMKENDDDDDDEYYPPITLAVSTCTITVQCRRFMRAVTLIFGFSRAINKLLYNGQRSFACWRIDPAAVRVTLQLCRPTALDREFRLTNHFPNEYVIMSLDFST